MSARPFTVFQDTTTEIQKIGHTNVTTTTINTATTLLSTLAAIEKENLHPVTGERAASAPSNAPKKRKTAVLVTKVLAPLSSSKKQKDLKSESKKSRKSSTSNGKKTDVHKKGARTSRSTRKASPLPRVDEEQEALTATPVQRRSTRPSISQSNIDSKCYELTVSPLADVSEAYDTATETSDQESMFDKEQSAEPENRDYFPPVLSLVSLPSGQTEVTPAPKTAPTFSTPQRKQIYSAFTFSSPSPSSERFRKTQYPISKSTVPNSE